MLFCCSESLLHITYHIKQNQEAFQSKHLSSCIPARTTDLRPLQM